MHRLSILLPAALAATLGVCRPDDAIDPFGSPTDDPPRAPSMIRVYLQVIEISHPTLSHLLAAPDKATLHARASALTKSGEARVQASSMLVARSGQKATLESIGKFIYPTDYEPTCQGLFGNHPASASDISSKMHFPPPLRPSGSTPTTFETRNTGITVEIEPTLGDAGEVVDLRIAPEFVDSGKLVTWQQFVDEWGDASIRMPQFTTWRTNSAITLTTGQFRLLSVFSSNPNASLPTISRMRLVFVRADVIQFSQPDEP